MTNRKPLRAREQALLNLHNRCQLSMDPFEFYSKWDVTQRQIAAICGCSLATVERWFGNQRQVPGPIYTRRLAEIDLIWELWEQIPPDIRERMCQRANVSKQRDS